MYINLHKLGKLIKFKGINQYEKLVFIFLIRRDNMASDSAEGILGITVPAPEFDPIPPEPETQSPPPPEQPAEQAPEEAPLPDYEGNTVDETV